MRKSSVIPKRFRATTIDRFMYMVRTLHDGQGRCIIKFSGHVDAARITLALRLTLDAEPILGCRFIENSWSPYWKRYTHINHIPLCIVVEPKDLKSELSKFMALPMNPYEDLQVQARIFRSEQDLLCIKLNHLVADGGGMIQYISTLAKIYRELSVDPTYHPQCNLQRSLELGRVFKYVGLPSLIRACYRFSYPRSSWGFPVTSYNFSGRMFAIRRVGPEQLAILKTYCRQYHASMGEVLLTAFYRALFEILSPSINIPLPVQVTVNLRQYLPQDRTRAISNLAGVFFPSIMRKPRETLGDTLGNIHDVMEKARLDQPWLGGVLYLELASLLNFSSVQRVVQTVIRRDFLSGKFHPCFSNIGVITSQQVDFGDVKVIEVSMFGPVQYPPASILSVNTFNDTMFLTTSYCDTAIDEKIIQRFLDLVVRELPK